MNLSDHVFVTYHGGCGGDLFTASCNGIDLDHSDPSHISVRYTPYSIKHHEHAIKSGASTLADICQPLPWTYISTHLISHLPDTLVNVVVDDQEVFHRVISRQMSIQHLKLTIGSGNFSDSILHACRAGKFDRAAKIWFEFAQRLSAAEMQQRREHGRGKKLNFDRLFHEDFVESLQSQGWQHNCQVLRKNHNAWLVNLGET